MGVANTDPATVAAERLEELAVDLNGRGFSARIEDAGSARCLYVFNPKAPRLSESISVKTRADDSWWFWWSWAEQLAPVDEVESAAVRIVYVLTPDA